MILLGTYEGTSDMIIPDAVGLVCLGRTTPSIAVLRFLFISADNLVASAETSEWIKNTKNMVKVVITVEQVIVLV